MTLPPNSALDVFTYAIEKNHLNLVESLISSGALDVNARLRFHNDAPLLVFAAQRQCVEIVECLLKHGARIDDVDADGQTACHVAARGYCGGSINWRREEEMVVLLLAYHPNLGLKDGRGVTSFVRSVYSANESPFELLDAGAPIDLADGPTRKALCHFATTSTTAVETLLEHGIVLSELRDDRNQTPLHHASFGDDFFPCTEALRMLIDECGVDLEARDSDGFTCTHYAVKQVDDFVLRCLIEAGADVHSRLVDGRTPLHVVHFHYCAMVLLAAGADVPARSRAGATPLHRIVSRDFFEEETNMEIVHACLAVGADLDAADSNGTTVRQLMVAQDMESLIDAEQIESARREITKIRLDFVRHRALEVCIGLQSLRLDALQMCEILVHACGPVAPVIAFHHWWKMATTVKHFAKQ